tara:strand:+ start:60 stop:1034 length:975 start_codon:yes stop_codon:yes gene_type:complete
MTKVVLSPATSGKTFNVKVSAINDVGVHSTVSSPSNITIATYSTAPALPTSISASSDDHAITIFFTNPADRDLKGVEIWYATSSGGSLSLIGSIDGAPGVAQEYNLNYDSATFSLNQTYYFKLRSVNTSNVASAYTSEVTAQFSTVQTSDVTMNAISDTSGSIVSYNANGESSTQDSISFSANGTGSDATTLQGFMASEVTLGTIDSTVAGFLINANALVSKRTLGSSLHSYAIVLQKLASNSYWTKANASGNYAVFIGSSSSTGASTTDGVQGNFNTSFIDDATGITSTTGTKYGLFIYETTETTGQYWIFGGTGLTVTELKR